MNVQNWIDDLLSIADNLKIGEDAAFAATYDEPFDDSESYPCFVIDPDSIRDEPQSDSAYPTGAFRRITEIYVLVAASDKTKAARKSAYQAVDVRIKALLEKFTTDYFSQEIRILEKTYPRFGPIGKQQIVQAGRLRFSVLMFEFQFHYWSD
ncbi:MAG: hypothetical protein J7L22_00265 [Candidatus Marinimicrobia bacterium]|nr:hypothetical protein [Candidatus Neomarinimicrobiota bacterium]